MERTLGSSGFAPWRVTKCFARWIAATSRTALTSMGSGTGFPASTTAWMSFLIECVSVLLGLISTSLLPEGIHFSRNVVGRVFHPCSLATNQNGTLGDISTTLAYTTLFAYNLQDGETQDRTVTVNTFGDVSRDKEKGLN